MPGFFRAQTGAFADSKARSIQYAEQQRAGAGTFLGDVISGASNVANAWITHNAAAATPGTSENTQALLKEGREIDKTIEAPDIQVPLYQEPVPELPTPPPIEPPPMQPAASSSFNFYDEYDDAISGDFKRRGRRGLYGSDDAISGDFKRRGRYGYNGR